MLFRFSLYGFLKNQQYYDPFLILAFLQAGMDFFRIGLLIGYREVLINVFEVPSGAVADLYGRRRAMMFSFCSFIVSFAVFAFSTAMWHFLVAMTFFALGDAFRTGTHKAMIFDYLAYEGRTQEKTHYYGTTRSWSKMGSALSIIIASTMVFFTVPVQQARGVNIYRYIFLASIVPYLIGLTNFAAYPKYLDGTGGQDRSVGKLLTHLFRVGRDSLRLPALRGLLVESMGYEGTYKVAKDYLQPIVKQTALAAPVLAAFHDTQRTAILIGVVYFALHLLESVASRRSDMVRRRLGGEEPAARFLWRLNFITFAMIAGGLGLDWYLNASVAYLGLTVAIAGFMALALLQNLWRPIHLGRFDTAGDAASGATILSVESQAKSLSAAILAPLLGLAVDWVRRSGVIRTQETAFLPVALAGLLIAAGLLTFSRFRRPAGERQASEPGSGSGQGV